jgi:flagellar hook-associated protein 1 FlgK
MVRGINANQLWLETVGHNIANANATGYSRQSVNLAATPALEQSALFGTQYVGTGTDSTSIVRARSVYADKQYWTEHSTESYYETRQLNYEKLETFFNDSDDDGIQNAIESFYKSWSELSSTASTSASRTAVLENGKIVSDRITATAEQLQDQIRANYDDIALNVHDVNKITSQIVVLNKSISAAEATGASANDLRDQRDNLADKLAGYMNINVYENEDGMYQIVSNGTTLVGGINSLTLQISDPVQNKKYGINDFSILIKETGTAYIPTNGKLCAEFDAIKEDKEYIDTLANMAGYFMTTLNEQHKQGVGIDAGQTTLNFYGASNAWYVWDNDNKQVIVNTYPTASAANSLQYEKVAEQKLNSNGVLEYTGRVLVRTTATGTPTSTERLDGMNIIQALKVNTELTAVDGQNKVAARAWALKTDAYGNYIAPSATYNPNDFEVNGTGDGENATLISNLFNSPASETVDTGGDRLSTNGSSATVTASVTQAAITVAANDVLSSTVLPPSLTPATTTNLAFCDRAVGTVSINNFYNAEMTQLGVDSEAMDDKVRSQADVVEQVQNWRDSVSAVNWNEELSNMIKFQQGYQASSRCLTAMDEMLDRLVNSTGTVGR